MRGWRRIRVGMARHFKVLGSPINHSKSPAIHSAAYDFLGLDWDYDRSRVEAGQLSDFLLQDASDGYSVTMPLKEEAYAISTRRDELATLSGTVNTLVRLEGGLSGFNTDVFGLSKAISSFDFEEYQLLGTGATARNAVIALAQNAPAATLTVTGRDKSKAQGIVDFAVQLGLKAQVADWVQGESGSLTIATLPGSADASMLVSRAEGTLFDVAYSPWPSSLGKLWLQNGGNLVSGIDMLVWQAIAQIRIFLTGSVADPLENEDALAKIMLAVAEK